MNGKAPLEPARSLPMIPPNCFLARPVPKSAWPLDLIKKRMPVVQSKKIDMVYRLKTQRVGFV